MKPKYLQISRHPNNRMHLTTALRLRRAGVQSQRGGLFEPSEPPAASGR